MAQHNQEIGEMTPYAKIPLTACILLEIMPDLTLKHIAMNGKNIPRNAFLQQR